MALVDSFFVRNVAKFFSVHEDNIYHIHPGLEEELWTVLFTEIADGKEAFLETLLYISLCSGSAPTNKNLFVFDKSITKKQKESIESIKEPGWFTVFKNEYFYVIVERFK